MDARGESERTPPARGVSGRFLPGTASPNPAGRPKGLPAMIRAETRDGAELVAFFVSVLRSPRYRVDARMAAGQWLADRGFGRAVVQLDAEGRVLGASVEATVTHLEAVRAHVREEDIDRLVGAFLGPGAAAEDAAG